MFASIKQQVLSGSLLLFISNEKVMSEFFFVKSFEVCFDAVYFILS